MVRAMGGLAVSATFVCGFLCGVASCVALAAILIALVGILWGTPSPNPPIDLCDGEGPDAL